MDVTIYHNPACGTSRNVLAIIREAGIAPRVIEYLKTPPSRAELEQMLALAGITPRDLLRAKEKLVPELGLDRPDVGGEAILDAMMAHPILINRPFVITPLGAKLCRPAELVRDLLKAA
jgi:arsenate reductase